MIEGTPAITITLPIQKPGAPDTSLRTRSAQLGMRVIRMQRWRAANDVPTVEVTVEYLRALRKAVGHGGRDDSKRCNHLCPDCDHTQK
jgi:hypothetical protein